MFNKDIKFKLSEISRTIKFNYSYSDDTLPISGEAPSVLHFVHWQSLLCNKTSVPIEVTSLKQEHGGYLDNWVPLKRAELVSSCKT